MSIDEQLDQHYDDIDLPDTTPARDASRVISIDQLRALEELVERKHERPRPEPKPCRRDEEPGFDALPLSA